MSLKLRLQLYYNFCVTAHFYVSPAPTSVKEVQFIHAAFNKIAPVEFFRIDRAEHTASHPWRQWVTVVLNASSHLSQLNPFNGIDETVKSTVDQLRQRQNDLFQYLRSVCGLPRYSYIENDLLYFKGQTSVPFQHTLSSNARGLKGKYRIIDSMIDHPFFVMETQLDPNAVLLKLRLNYQKFHKMRPLIIKGYQVNRKGNYHKLDDELFIQGNPVMYAVDLMNLDAELPITKPVNNSKSFEGFLIKSK